MPLGLGPRPSKGWCRQLLYVRDADRPQLSPPQTRPSRDGHHIREYGVALRHQLDDPRQLDLGEWPHFSGLRQSARWAAGNDRIRADPPIVHRPGKERAQ